MSTPSATRELVAFVQRLDPARLPGRVVRQICRAVLDLIGVAIAGTRTPMSRTATRFAFAQHATDRLAHFKDNEERRDG